MFKNTYYNRYTHTMHLWEQINGENLYTEIPWIPFVFVKGDKTCETKAIDGIPVSRLDFGTFERYETFCKTHKDDVYENLVKPEVQFLSERYSGIADTLIQPPKLKTYVIDIEVHKDMGFPNVDLAEDPIVLISVFNCLTGKTIVFGEKEYTGPTENFTYVHCVNEKILLKKFLLWWHQFPADVITGWNISNFDLPYIFNRVDNIFGEKTQLWKLLSPIKRVSKWRRGKYTLIDIAGSTILDYMEIYKEYSPVNLERYSLDHVSNYELEKGKLDYSGTATSLRDLYYNDWPTYVHYNRIDTKRVAQLEEKLGFIALIQMLSLYTKTPLKYYNKVTTLVEGAMLTYMRRNNLCGPTLKGGSQETYEAAIVKEPQKGKHDWLAYFDVTSEYPTAIITLNMSLETYYGRIIGFTEEEILKFNRKKEYPAFSLKKFGIKKIFKVGDKKLDIFNAALKAGHFAIAPNGVAFFAKSPGTIATVERNLFNTRIELDNKRDRLKKKGRYEEADRIKLLTNAVKRILNSVYGGFSVPYSRYFNRDIAEAITSCGRHILRSGEKFVNKLGNNPNLHEEFKAVIDEIKEEI